MEGTNLSKSMHLEEGVRRGEMKANENGYRKARGTQEEEKERERDETEEEGYITGAQRQATGPERKKKRRWDKRAWRKSLLR